MERRWLQDYRIEGIVGAGRMGVVYLAIDSRTGRAVALKVLREDVSADPVYRERFRREGDMLASLSHPHIVPTYGRGEFEGELYIAMRMTTGSLRDVLLRGPLDLRVAMGHLTAVASALDAAHAAGIVHRDVKPANVLLDPGPRVFLGDFGLARSPELAGLTAPGQVLGSIDYMAPEMLDGDSIDAAIDVYALACLAVEMLTGQVPYLRDTEAAVLYAHVIDPAPSVRERRPELPSALDDVIAAGMAKDPDERPSGAGVLVAEMHHALGEAAPAGLVTSG
jgi:serine/threonine protein kinase